MLVKLMGNEGNRHKKRVNLSKTHIAIIVDILK